METRLTKQSTVLRSLTHPPPPPPPPPPRLGPESELLSCSSFRLAFVDKNPPALQPDNEPPSTHAGAGTTTAFGSYLYSRHRPYPAGREGGGPALAGSGGVGFMYDSGGGRVGEGLSSVAELRWCEGDTYCASLHDGPSGQNPARYAPQGTLRICLRGQSGPEVSNGYRGRACSPSSRVRHHYRQSSD